MAKHHRTGLVVSIGATLALAAAEHSQAHFVPWPHTHSITNVMGPYEIPMFMRTAAMECNPSSNTQTGIVRFSRYQGYENRWAASLGTPENLVSARVGFDVSRSGGEVMTSSHPVMPGYCVRLRLYYVYDVTDFIERVDIALLGPVIGAGSAWEYRFPLFMPVESRF